MTVLVPLALFAGLLTTVAGMGGGLVLLLGLSTFMDPLTALMITGPGLLIGNLHRLWLYREHVQWPIARRFAAGAIPGALIGGMVAVAVPGIVLRLAMIALATLAVARVLLGWKWKPPISAMVPGGLATGFTTATSGGGGLIAGPLLLSSGLSGKTCVGTGAVGAAAVHLARLAGYGAGGALEPEPLLLGLVAAACIAAGNLLGDKARDLIPPVAVPRLEVGVVMGCLGMALLGLA